MRHVALMALLGTIALTSGCQVRGFFGFGNEPAQPPPASSAPRAVPVRPVVAQPDPSLAATSPIKTEDSVIFPRPQAPRSAPQSLQPDRAVRAMSVSASSDSIEERRLPPMPAANDPKVTSELRALLTQAGTALVRGEPGRATQLYEKAAQQAQFNPYVLHGLALAEARQGRFAKARSLAARAGFMNSRDTALAQANARLLDELDEALASRAPGTPARRRR